MKLKNIELPQSEIEEFCRRWNIVELSLFGSVLRDDFSANSDVDVMVAFAEGVRWSFPETLAMEDELAALFGRPVDLVERRLVLARRSLERAYWEESIERSENYIRRRHILQSVERIYVA